MSAPFNTIDLTTLGLKSGEGRRIEAETSPGEFNLGGQDYSFGSADATIPIRLDISRTATGHALRLRIRAELEGPCMRCLTASSFPVEVDAREVHQPDVGDEELTSPYVADSELDIGAWAHDALALALPQALLCRPDCAGLCPECGVSLNDFAPGEHVHEREPDPRWDKLRELLD